MVLTKGDCEGTFQNINFDYFLTQLHCTIFIVIFQNFGTPKIINFPFLTNGKLIILGAPVLKHIVVFSYKTRFSLPK